jgi:hypothetical protein
MHNDVIFLSVQPDEPYFYWQVEVFIHNAISVGVNPKQIQIIFACSDGKPKKDLIDLSTRYKFVNFFFYEKYPGVDHGYISVLRPHALEQHFLKFPELRGKVIFYHDADIIFTKIPPFETMIYDNFWYLSDTESYIGANYIKSKSDLLLTELCDLVNIERSIVENNQKNSGGAQYLMKGLTHIYWKEVKDVCLKLYKYMSDREQEERKTLTEEQLKTYNPIQKWCSDMWAVLWCAWKNGHQTKVVDELSFSWASDYSNIFKSYNIMHNAGIIETDKNHKFFKGEFIDKSPFDTDLSYVDPNSNTWNYVQAIEYAKIQRKEIFGS